MNIVWTKQAEESFNNILDYLLQRWITKEANNFIDLANDVIIQIYKNSELFKLLIFDAESREVIITKQTSLFYGLINKDIIEIEYFWNNYRYPKGLEQSVKNK